MRCGYTTSAEQYKTLDSWPEDETRTSKTGESVLQWWSWSFRHDLAGIREQNQQQLEKTRHGLKSLNDCWFLRTFFLFVLFRFFVLCIGKITPFDCESCHIKKKVLRALWCLVKWVKLEGSCSNYQRSRVQMTPATLDRVDTGSFLMFLKRLWKTDATPGRDQQHLCSAYVSLETWCASFVFDSADHGHLRLLSKNRNQFQVRFCWGGRSKSKAVWPCWPCKASTLDRSWTAICKKLRFVFKWDWPLWRWGLVLGRGWGKIFASDHSGDCLHTCP